MFSAKALADLRADTPGVAEVVHFNNSGAGLVPRPVLAASVAHLELEARVGGYEAAARRADAVAGFYTATAELIGARPDEIAFAGSATQAYATALSAVPFEAGDLILTTRNDFVSNQIQFLSLRKRFGVEIAHAPDLPEGGVDVEAMAAMMRRRRPRLVAATDIPTNSGLVQPVAAIGRHCRELDLLYIVDACQSLGQYPIDVAEIGCDFLTSTCRKYLRGPRGSGLLYTSGRVLDAGYTPLFVDMRGARWTGPDTYAPVAGAGRFEDWEFPYAVLLGCAEAARYAMDVGVDAIAERSPMLGARLRDGLAGLPGVRVLDRGARLSAMVTAAITGWEPDAFKAALDARRINSALSFPEFAVLDFADKAVDWAIRLSPHYYNTEDEVDTVIAAVAELVA